jgi:hypothetical protein
LLKHKIYHDDTKRFECSKCEMKFYRKSNLKGHFQRVHTNERNFPC